MDFSSLKVKINVSIKNKIFYIIVKQGVIGVLFRDLSPCFSLLECGNKILIPIF